MRILSVVGARPQFVKLAPIANEARRRGIDHVIVHTGQHYDPMLSDVFFNELGIPAPDVHLGVGSSSHGKQTGAMLSGLDDVLAEQRPEWTVVYGDTNSTLAAAISAVKMHLPVAHLEAGLRSFNRRMPEEHNRVLTDHAADMLLAPTITAAAHLTAEGLERRTKVVGDVMTDVLFQVRDTVGNTFPRGLKALGLAPGSYSVATIHRAENTDSPQRLHRIFSSLSAIDHPILLLAHPRLLAKAREHGLNTPDGNVTVRPAIGYRDLVAAITNARGVITDSGGLQKEAFLLRVPCTTVRSETEWVETVESGWNVLAEPGGEMVEAAERERPRDTEGMPYGDGHAAERVLDALENRLSHSV